MCDGLGFRLFVTVPSQVVLTNVLIYSKSQKRRCCLWCYKEFRGALQSKKTPVLTQRYTHWYDYDIVPWM